MYSKPDGRDPKEIAAKIDADLRVLKDKNTATFRSVRRNYTETLVDKDAQLIRDIAGELISRYNNRWIAYELIRYHNPAFHSLGGEDLEKIGEGIDSWDTVDAFARILSGPVWLEGQIADETIHKWARSEDLWWRRAALVSTVALNLRSQGGPGDTPRTLAVCQMLVDDHEDMVEKALSWALRALVVHDPQAVSEFLEKCDSKLGARVKREVRNKLTTGLKNPK